MIFHRNPCSNISRKWAFALFISECIGINFAFAKIVSSIYFIRHVLQDIKHLTSLLDCAIVKKVRKGAWKVLWSFMTSRPYSFKFLYHVGNPTGTSIFFALLHLIPAAWTDVIRHLNRSRVFSCMLIKRCIYKGGRVYELNAHRMPLVPTLCLVVHSTETHF